MIGRRTLIRIAALAGASTAFEASIVLPSSSRPHLAAGGTDATRVMFKIDGWGSCDDGATGDPTAASIETALEAWISVDRSWRAAWR